MPKFRLTLSIGLQGKHEEIVDIPEAELQGDDDEVQHFLEEYWQAWTGNFIDGGISPVE